MGELVKGGGSQYTDEDRRNAAMHYAIYGNQTKVSEMIGIPQTTISLWRNHTDWWDDLVAQIRNEKQDEHIAKYTGLVDKALAQCESTLDKASPKDAAIIAATFTEDLSRKWDEKQVNVVSVQEGVGGATLVDGEG